MVRIRLRVSENSRFKHSTINYCYQLVAMLQPTHHIIHGGIITAADSKIVFLQQPTDIIQWHSLVPQPAITVSLVKKGFVGCFNTELMQHKLLALYVAEIAFLFSCSHCRHGKFFDLGRLPSRHIFVDLTHNTDQLAQFLVLLGSLQYAHRVFRIRVSIKECSQQLI